MHNLEPDVGGRLIPGQSGRQSDYLPSLARIVQRLVEVRQRHKHLKLLFGLTSPWICDESQDAIIRGLNVQARKLMANASIPIVDLHAAVVGRCGAAPQKTCLNLTGGGCPHYSNDGYEWIANSTLVPAFKEQLAAVEIAV
ncbi:unnamed protein product [Polarella glacialis]|uniref:SGNH hydrolase-type esterase domain-containing protein n=2 Tax=Polarella glacialis TaxID=89957 RepID=A0A813H3Z3_POLGL|nr:unnamed protein product [Polarella glacialis]